MVQVGKKICKGMKNLKTQLTNDLIYKFYVKNKSILFVLHTNYNRICIVFKYIWTIFPN